MATSAFKGGITLKLGDGAGTEVFTAIGEVIDLDGIGESSTEIDVTHMGSTAREFIPGMVTGNVVTARCSLVLAQTQQDAIITDYKSGVERNFEVVIADGTTTRTGAFAMVLLSYGHTYSGDQSAQNQLEFSGRITGGVTWTDV